MLISLWEEHPEFNYQNEDLFHALAFVSFGGVGVPYLAVPSAHIAVMKKPGLWRRREWDRLPGLRPDERAVNSWREELKLEEECDWMVCNLVQTPYLKLRNWIPDQAGKILDGECRLIEIPIEVSRNLGIERTAVDHLDIAL